MPAQYSSIQKRTLFRVSRNRKRTTRRSRHGRNRKCLVNCKIFWATEKSCNNHALVNGFCSLHHSLSEKMACSCGMSVCEPGNRYCYECMSICMEPECRNSTVIDEDVAEDGTTRKIMCTSFCSLHGGEVCQYGRGELSFTNRTCPDNRKKLSSFCEDHQYAEMGMCIECRSDFSYRSDAGLCFSCASSMETIDEPYLSACMRPGCTRPNDPSHDEYGEGSSYCLEHKPYRTRRYKKITDRQNQCQCDDESEGELNGKLKGKFKY